MRFSMVFARIFTVAPAPDDGIDLFSEENGSRRQSHRPRGARDRAPRGAQG
jgi:hypothetical protein